MNFRAPILVGLLLLSAASATTWFVVSTSKDKYDDASPIHLFADFSDASGIRWKTRIQINGIDVGKIDGVEHVQRDDGTLMARVKVRVLKKYAIYQNAVIRKAAESLLGDFRLDLIPGTSDTPRLEAGGIIQKVQSISDMEEIQNELKHVARNINRITNSFQSVLTGPAGEGSLQAILRRMEKSMEAIEKTTQTLSLSLERNNHHINNTLSNIDTFSSQLVGVMSEGGALGEVTSNAAQLTQRLNLLVGNLTGALTGSEEGLAQNSPLGASINNLNESIEHLNSITRKVDNGQGTAGRLINDAGIVEKVEQTLDDTNEIIGSLSKLETQVELRTEYGVPFDGDNELVQKAIKLPATGPPTRQVLYSGGRRRSSRTTDPNHHHPRQQRQHHRQHHSRWQHKRRQRNRGQRDDIQSNEVLRPDCQTLLFPRPALWHHRKHRRPGGRPLWPRGQIGAAL